MPVIVTTAPALDEVRGMTLMTAQTNGFSGVGLTQALTNIRAMGATWVSIVIWWYQTVYTDTSMDGTWNTTDADVINAIDTAHSLGLKVMMKPHVRSGDWQDINPSNKATWFSNTGSGLSGGYQYFMSHYATIAADHDAEMFCVGCELPLLSTSTYLSNWTTVINAVRAIYSGPLTYAAKANEYTTVGFWSLVDYIGIDAYFVLNATPTTDLPTLIAAWNSDVSTLAAFSASNGNKKILFTEVGYPSEDNAAVIPWDGNGTGNADSGAAQTACYTALLTTCTGQPWFAGIFAWAFWDEINAYATKGLSVGGKAAQTTIANAWAGTAVAPTWLPIRIYKGTTDACQTSYTALPNLWPVDDGTYATVDNGPTYIGISKTSASMSASFAFSGAAAGSTHTIRIRRTTGTPTTIATGSPVSGASGTCTVTATQTVTVGERYIIEGICTGTAGTWTAGTDQCFTIS